MCLLVVISRVDERYPLIVAGNRDELLERPAVAMTALADGVLGGRDEQAGGTWMAVNRHGVVAGLTNRPATAGRDPSRRSRGELPLALASHGSAAEAVEKFAALFTPSDYNPAWLLVGDRESLFSLDMTEGDTPAVAALDPGIHVLENRALGAPSPKVDHVRALVAQAQIPEHLHLVLSDHHLPPMPKDRPAAVGAACVHTEKYGTRWSGIVLVPAHGAPRFSYADGPPCTTSFVDAEWE